MTEKEEEHKASSSLESPPLRKPPWVTSPMTFVNTREFSREALHFMKHKCYTKAPEGTMAWREYWAEQDRRCREGYSVGGVHITGKHYDYLNFTQIEAKLDGENRKRLMFPRFLDIDYYFYHEVEEAIRRGKGLCVAKSRRKGVSYKASHLAKWEYNFKRESRSIIGAYLDEYSNNTMSMAVEMINFINAKTAWAKQKLINLRDYQKSGRKVVDKNGVETEMGYKSEIFTLTFHKNTSASIGKSSHLFLFEEAGKWPGLLESYNFTYPSFKDGTTSNAFWIIFGTGGDMLSGATEDFQKLFYNPSDYDLLAYENVYEEGQVGEAGLFIDDAWYKPPYLDEHGNSDRPSAIAYNMSELERKKAQGIHAVEAHMTQFPLKPSEAFFISSGTFFPQQIIADQLRRIQSDNRLKTYGQKGVMKREAAGVDFEPKEGLYECPYPYKKELRKGCVVIYEKPELVDGEVPRGLYIASLDPYAQKSADTDSVASAFIYKKCLSHDKTYNMIVAEYTGRPETLEEYYDALILLLEYYNAVLLFENNIQGVQQHFTLRRSLRYLALQPKSAIASVIPKSTVDRHYGVHMNPQLKIAGLTWLAEWLKEEKAPGHYNVNDIWSEHLLRELLVFDNDPKKNFDRVSSMIILMFLMQEEKFRFNKEVRENTDYSVTRDLERVFGWDRHLSDLQQRLNPYHTPWDNFRTNS